MENRHESVEKNLQAIRELMQNSIDKSNDGILELTEDDLVDDQDEDAFSHLEIKKEKKQHNVNEFLTQIPHSIKGKETNIDLSQENLVFADRAAKSIEAIKNLTKKVENPFEQSQLSKNTSLEEKMIEMLKPMLEEWLNKNIPAMVQEIIEKDRKNG